MTRTTMEHSTRGYVRMPYLTERERESVIAAVDAGELILLMLNESGGIGYGSIVALATDDSAEHLTASDGLEDLTTELDDARRELAALTTIISEVFAETDPSDHRWKLDDAAADVTKALTYAIELAEKL